MNAPRRFWSLLALVSAGALVLLFALSYLLPSSEPLSPFILVCVAAFICVNIIAYYSGIRAVQNKSKYRFVQLMMILILFKMILCLVMVVAHIKINKPESKAFVLPFLTIYIIFTIFEIFVLEKIARTKPSSTDIR